MCSGLSQGAPCLKLSKFESDQEFTIGAKKPHLLERHDPRAYRQKGFFETDGPDHGLTVRPHSSSHGA